MYAVLQKYVSVTCYTPAKQDILPYVGLWCIYAARRTVCCSLHTTQKTSLRASWRTAPSTLRSWTHLQSEVKDSLSATMLRNVLTYSDKRLFTDTSPHGTNCPSRTKLLVAPLADWRTLWKAEPYPALWFAEALRVDLIGRCWAGCLRSYIVSPPGVIHHGCASRKVCGVRDWKRKETGRGRSQTFHNSGRLVAFILAKLFQSGNFFT